MGTPHAGAEKEKMGQILRKFAKAAGCDTNKKILEVFNPRSEVLAIIEQDFQKYLRNQPGTGLPPIKVHNFHEERG
jgi:hypothetical protein